MSRLACAFAFVYMAWDSAEKAAGVQPQHLLSADALWVWWIAAVGFLMAAVAVLCRGAP